MAKIAILFSGQGAQTPGMGKDIYESSDCARAVFDMGEKLSPGINRVCFEGSQEEITRTENAQPCLFLTGLALAYALKQCGITADAAAGFSLGEIPALAYSGVLSDEDAFTLVKARAKKMAELSEIHRGGMVAALKLDSKTVENICDKFDDVWAVNYNCPGQTVCAGSPESLDSLCEAIKEQGGRAVKLSVSGAFHTKYMSDARPVLESVLDGMEVHKPKIALYSNVTGAKYPTDRKGIISAVSDQVCSPVRWQSIIENMHTDGVDTFIEVGAGSTLCGFVKRTLSDVKILNVTDSNSLEAAVNDLTGENS